MKQNILITIFFVLGFVLLVSTADSAWEKNEDSHNINLCESAKISGNQDYLTKCEVYYNTGDINYLR